MHQAHAWMYETCCCCDGGAKGTASSGGPLASPAGPLGYAPVILRWSGLVCALRRVLVDAMSVLRATPVIYQSHHPPSAGCAGSHNSRPNQQWTNRPAYPVDRISTRYSIYPLIDVISFSKHTSNTNGVLYHPAYHAVKRVLLCFVCTGLAVDLASIRPVHTSSHLQDSRTPHLYAH